MQQPPTPPIEARPSSILCHIRAPTLSVEQSKFKEDLDQLDQMTGMSAILMAAARGAGMSRSDVIIAMHGG